jgi:hypothetical protein
MTWNPNAQPQRPLCKSCPDLRADFDGGFCNVDSSRLIQITVIADRARISYFAKCMRDNGGYPIG